jgi:hypothetical protein
MNETTDITWLPSKLMDETFPPPRPSPDDWITSLDDGAPAIENGEDYDQQEPTLLHDGEVILFQRCDHYGNANLTLAADGGWKVDRPKPPVATDVVAINGWQYETHASSVDECATMLVQAEADPGDYEISYYSWSDDIPHRFDAKARSFMPVRPTNG